MRISLHRGDAGVRYRPHGGSRWRALAARTLARAEREEEISIEAAGLSKRVAPRCPHEILTLDWSGLVSRRTLRRVSQMASAFMRLAICATVTLIASAWVPTQASAVTLSYGYSGTGDVSFQSDTTLNLGGACLSPCVIFATMMISGTGPAFDLSIPSGWLAGATTTVTDNLGDTMVFGVNTGTFPGTIHDTAGGFFSAAILPSTLDISTSSFASFLGGPGTVSLSINILLPEGAYVTPLPAALPLFATGLGVLGLIGWRRKRKAQAFA
jgi:hypothetical protein